MFKIYLGCSSNIDFPFRLSHGKAQAALTPSETAARAEQENVRSKKTGLKSIFSKCIFRHFFVFKNKQKNDEQSNKKAYKYTLLKSLNFHCRGDREFCLIVPD